MNAADDRQAIRISVTSDLLAALKAMRDTVLGYGFGPNTPDDIGNAAYDAAVAAIAKAEGAA